MSTKPLSRAIWLEAEACAALANQEAGVAEPYLREAVAGWRSMQRPYDQLRALAYLGQALRQRGRVAQARATWGQALEIVDSLASQLEDSDLKAAFLKSPFLQEIQTHQSL
ncbi:MAG: hypothetical protein KDF65_13760, partial [Anaerolineae bacterium]|nr:hypothetical protein [Anaerolineae bacterium]